MYFNTCILLTCLQIVDYVHESKGTHKRDVRIRKKLKTTGNERRKSKIEKRAENQAKFSVMNIRN